MTGVQTCALPILGKFAGGLATLTIALVSLWLLIIGLGLFRLGVPPSGEEVARGVVFLASPASSFTTGTNLVIDGALTRGVQY